jgi:hypothetical protein
MPLSFRLSGPSVSGFIFQGRQVHPLCSAEVCPRRGAILPPLARLDKPLRPVQTGQTCLLPWVLPDP